MVTVEKQIAAIVEEAHPNMPDLMTDFGWECEKSPIGFCLYNNKEDPQAEHCIHCGEPYVRVRFQQVEDDLEYMEDTTPAIDRSDVVQQLISKGST
jgi:hypothetical protein